MFVDRLFLFLTVADWLRQIIKNGRNPKQLIYTVMQFSCNAVSILISSMPIKTAIS